MIEYVVKLGGSLLYVPDKLKKLLIFLKENNDCNFAVTVGSGPYGELYKKQLEMSGSKVLFDDSVRDYASIQSLNASTLAGMCDGYMICCSRDDILKAQYLGKIPILDARGFLAEYKDSKYQKSDVRSAIICNSIGCKNLIIVTDVAGIYESDPKKNFNSEKIDCIKAEDLLNVKKSCVDEGLAECIIRYDLKCYVIGYQNFIINSGKINEETYSTGTYIRRLKI